VKPVALIADAIRDCSRRGETVLDGFGGSGSTLIAAKRTRRSARIIEYDPVYCDTIVRPWEKVTGKRARLADTGLVFEDIAETRALLPLLESAGRAAEGLAAVTLARSATPRRRSSTGFRKGSRATQRAGPKARRRRPGHSMTRRRGPPINLFWRKPEEQRRKEGAQLSSIGWTGRTGWRSWVL
jgi:hypothetical protein